MAAVLSDPELHRALSGLIRRRIPTPDAEDVVQATLADALSAARVPDDATELRRWVFGIARNKVADYFRLGRREIPHEPPALEATAEPTPEAAEPHSARDLLRWAEGLLPETDSAQQTFDWMLREGQGEKLEAIAAEEKLPAPQVRKRVSRLRQLLKRKWVLELAAVAALGLTVLVARELWRGTHSTIEVGPDRTARSPEADHARDLQNAAELRRAGLQACAIRDFRRCLEQLDQAAEIDVLGDATEDVRRARESAREAGRPDSQPSQPDSRPAGQAPASAPAGTGTAPKKRSIEGATQSAPNTRKMRTEKPSSVAPNHAGSSSSMPVTKQRAHDPDSSSQSFKPGMLQQGQ